jgi:uncharacterized membrane protein YdbT with pleckstrin-like domain
VQLRASIKLIQVAYIFCLLLALAIVGYLLAIHNQDDRMWALLALPALLAVYTVVRHVQRRLVKLTIADGRLRYEAGAFSKTTRTMELAKVQDVRVDQTIGQRLLNIGDLSLETAGEASRIVIRSIDRPQEAAHHILDLSRNSHPSV